MIESCYWKEELARIASTLEPVRAPPRYSERRLCIVERDLMIGFFMLRRLLELHKVSTVTGDMNLVIYSCRMIGQNVTSMNSHRIWELYDLENERKESKKPFFLTNQFIHACTSYVTRDDSRNWCDVYVVSDKVRHDCIWRVPISEVIRLFRAASMDYPHTVSMRFNPKTRDYDVTTN